MLSVMMAWNEAEVATLARELLDSGLATPNRYNHLSLDPALCPYLKNLLDDTEHDTLTARWVAEMRNYVDFLYQQLGQNAEIAAVLTPLELPNLLALLADVARAPDAEATVDLATKLHTLLAVLGRPRLLVQVSDVRNAAAAQIRATWTHAHFQTENSRINELLASGRLRDALDGAQTLLQQARTAGVHAYSGADYDLGIACWLIGHAVQMTGNAQQALPHLDEAQRRLEAVEEARPGKGAVRAASLCLTERGNCLLRLGRLDEAVTTFEETARQALQRQDEHGLAIAKAQLGTVRLRQRRYQDALDAYAEAREHFTRLGDPGSVATAWHEMGRAHRESGDRDAAENAYSKSLAIREQLCDARAQAGTLLELANLYAEVGRLEDATSLYRTATDHSVATGDAMLEGRCLNNLSHALHLLSRWDEARQAIHRAIECKQPFGHTAEPWTTWALLADIEGSAGNADHAAQAKARAFACYLAYRRDGGENHHDDGRIGLAVTAKLVAGHPVDAIADLDELLADPELRSPHRAFVVALRAIAAGSRDRSLAEAPDLNYTSAAELLCVIDALGA